jgi:hypothetical protein
MSGGFGSAGVPAAILNFRRPAKASNSKSESPGFNFEAGQFREMNMLPC